VGQILDNDSCLKSASQENNCDTTKKDKKKKKEKKNQGDEEENVVKFFAIDLECLNEEVPGGRDKVRLRFKEFSEY